MRVACHQCQSVLKAPARLAGTSIKCPRCSATLLLPNAPQPHPSPLESATASDDLIRVIGAIHDVRDAVEESNESGGGVVAVVLRSVAWFCAIVWTFFVAFSYMKDSQAATINAIQQAALAADSCFWILAPYIIARGFDSATRTS